MLLDRFALTAQNMALILATLVLATSFTGSFAEAPVEAALAADDVCLGEDCGLELRQLRGELVADEFNQGFEQLLAEDEDEDEDEDEEEDDQEVEDVAEDEEADELTGRRCFTKMDNAAFKKGGAKKFNAALEHCGRSCAAGFPCTKTCMHKAGYSWGCSICAAKLVGCGRDHCVNQCISNSFSPACQHCNKAHCRKSMQACSGRALGGS